VIGMSPQAAAVHATREDPGPPLTDLITLIACVVSRPGWCICWPPGPAAAGRLWRWPRSTPPRYALLYHSDGHGGIDFNQAEPLAYVDSACAGRAGPGVDAAPDQRRATQASGRCRA
jgi:hypothetical protein